MQSGLESDVTTRTTRPETPARIDTPLTAAYIDLRTSREHFRGNLRHKVQLNESGHH